MRPGFSCAVLASALAAGGAARADVTLNFFGDINYVVDRDESAPTTNTFRAAELDIFASQTEGKFSFIGEVIIEALGENEFSADVDRLEVAYKPTPWLRLRAGRIRSAIGYYGDAYQNGKYFMIPVSWPGIYEGDGFDGILPSHSIGLHADAAYDLGNDRGKLTLDAELLNGRGNGLDVVPVWQDANNAKAVNFRPRYVAGGALDGLILGGNLYIDDIPADEPDAAETPDDIHPAMHELMLGGHAAYVTDHVHLVSEVAWFRHTTHDTQMTSRTITTFSEAGYHLGDITPYARFEYTHYYEVDPFFTSSGIPSTDVERLSAGVKYAASASVALKVEGSADLNHSHHHLVGQAAFAF